jgi:hypothetical protein
MRENWNSSHFDREIFGQMGWEKNTPRDEEGLKNEGAISLLLSLKSDL